MTHAPNGMAHDDTDRFRPRPLRWVLLGSACLIIAFGQIVVARQFQAKWAAWHGAGQALRQPTPSP